MESSNSQNFFQQSYNEAIEKFTEYVKANQEMFSEDDIKSFLQSLFKKSSEIKSIPEKIETKDLKEFLLNKINKCKFVEKENIIKEILFELSKSKLGEVIKSKGSLNIGNEKPNTKKAYMNIEIASNKTKQENLLSKFSFMEIAKFENSFGILKMTTTNAEEAKQIIEQLLDMAKPFLESFNQEILRPEFKVFNIQNNILIQISQTNNLYFMFFSILLFSLRKKFPDYNFGLKLNAQFGTNFKDLINNHTDNTLKDLLEGGKISLEFENNISEFFKVTMGLLLKTNNLENKQRLLLTVFTFLIGSVSFNTDINVNIGKNEEIFMKQLPFLNLFEKDNEMLNSFTQIFKMMKEENDLVKDVMPILNSFEGKVDFLLHTPIGSLNIEFDGMGFLELINHISDTQ